jgi:hypothetical protein
VQGLSGRDTKAFFDRFAERYRQRGNKVTGLSRAGKTFTVDVEHGSGGMRPDVLRKACTYMGISPDEFDDWLKSR